MSSVNYTVVVNDGTIRALRSPGGALYDHLTAAAGWVVVQSQAAAPVKSGYLRSRIRHVPHVGGDETYTDVISDARNPRSEDGFPYARYQEKRQSYMRRSLG